MATLLDFNEVDEVDLWLSSPKRDEVIGPLGVTARTVVAPRNPNHVGLLAEIPGVPAFEAITASEAGAKAMRFDGVRPDTLVTLVES